MSDEIQQSAAAPQQFYTAGPAYLTPSLNINASQAVRETIDRLGKGIFAASFTAGKICLTIYWVACVAIVIYWIALVVIVYRRVGKYEWVEPEDGKAGYFIDTSSTGNYATLTPAKFLVSSDTRTWNINRAIMNGLLALLSLYAIVLFMVVNVGKSDLKSSDGSMYTINPSRGQLAYVMLIAIMWYGLCFFWDVKFQYMTDKSGTTTTTSTAEAVSEGFANAITEGFQTMMNSHI